MPLRKCKRYGRKAPPIPKALLLLRERKPCMSYGYPYMAELIIKCCAAHPRCKHEAECKRLYGFRCNQWPVIGENIESYTRKQPPMSVVVVIPLAGPSIEAAAKPA